MALIQRKIQEKYLKTQPKTEVEEKWSLYKKQFLNLKIQENIRNSNEEQYQDGFLNDFFVNILGYTKSPNLNFNLISEQKNVKDGKKADGAIIFAGKVVAVIELKSTKTIDLGKIETQAFGYKNNQPECTYVIISNFEKLRFYIDNAIEYAEFNLFQLSEKDFEVLYLFLSKESIKNDLPKKMKSESENKEKEITQRLYNDYQEFKQQLFQNIRKNNPEFEAVLLYKKTQKLLDRFLFLFFAQAKLLINTKNENIIHAWKFANKWKFNVSLYELYRRFFVFISAGNHDEDANLDVFGYNGGLFAPDEILDKIRIDDDILEKHTKILAEYDFDSEVDVNILGRIFENSLTELEDVAAEYSDEKNKKTQGKRKKDGIFYTPQAITKFIIDHTIVAHCRAKKADLAIHDEDFFTDKKRTKTQHNELLQKLEAYRTWLKTMTILDPSCGSGAFLNEALTFLMSEYAYIDALQTRLVGGSIVFPNYSKDILENNLFGVDINEESVEIAKLSLWLRTAKKGVKLNDLSNNIKCGNSLIADKAIAREKAFDWHAEFPQVFEKGGFDFVIGNPPYVGMQRLKLEDKENLRKQNFQTFENTGDIYMLFYEKGIQLLKSKGILAFITSRQWMQANYGKVLRKFLLEKTNPLLLIDFGQNNLFEGATVFVNILITSNANNENKMLGYLLDEKTDWVKQIEDIEERLQLIDKFDENSWKISNSKSMLKTIEAKGKSLFQLIENKEILMNRGITSGYNDAFHISEEIKNDLIKADAKNAEIIKPFLKGKNIKRYGYSFEDLYMLFIPWHFPLQKKTDMPDTSNEAEVNFIQEYPAIYKHLIKFKNELLKRNQMETAVSYEWYALQRFGANYWQEFEKPKIVWIEISDKANYAYDDKGMFLTNSAYFLTVSENCKYGLKYILAILNSKVSDYYFSHFTAQIAGGRMRYTKQYVEKIIIPDLEKDAQKPFEILADYILWLKVQDFDNINDKMMHYYFENAIDMAVFEIFFPEEVKSFLSGKKIEKSIFESIQNLPKEPNLEKIREIYNEFQQITHPIRNAISAIQFHKPFSDIFQQLNH